MRGLDTWSADNGYHNPIDPPHMQMDRGTGGGGNGGSGVGGYWQTTNTYGFIGGLGHFAQGVKNGREGWHWVDGHLRFGKTGTKLRWFSTSTWTPPNHDVTGLWGNSSSSAGLGGSRNSSSGGYGGGASNDGVDIQHETQAYANLNAAEREFLRNNPSAGPIIYQNMNRAFKATEALFPGVRAVNNAADAFRHAYWSALNARALGYDMAFYYGVAHEQFPGNDPLARQMDLYNNIFGHNLTILQPNMSNAQMQAFIYNAVLSGELQMIFGGQLAPTH